MRNTPLTSIEHDIIDGGCNSCQKPLSSSSSLYTTKKLKLRWPSASGGSNVRGETENMAQDGQNPWLDIVSATDFHGRFLAHQWLSRWLKHTSTTLVQWSIGRYGWCSMSMPEHCGFIEEKGMTFVDFQDQFGWVVGRPTTKFGSRAHRWLGCASYWSVCPWGR